MFDNINIQGIVLEEMDKYFNTLLISEGSFKDKKKQKVAKNQEKRPKNKKMSDKQKAILKKIEKAFERDGAEATENNAEMVINFLRHPCINASKVLELATGLDPTSASSEASKIANKEPGWEVSENLVKTVNRIKAELAS